MEKPTMTNSEYLELCREQNIKDPDILGFLFPEPITNFIPPSITDSGIFCYPEYPMISSCCFRCADEFYFERTIEEIKEQWNLCNNKELSQCTVNGKLMTTRRTLEEVADLDRKDEEDLQRNLQHYLAMFPKEDLNSGIIIQLNEDSLEAHDWEWECDICEAAFGY